LILSDIHFSSTNNFKIAAFATSVSKFASSSPSPASARVILVASAPNFYMQSLIVKKFPVDLDIFSLLRTMYPLQK
jgi:hypothetical protein